MHQATEIKRHQEGNKTRESRHHNPMEANCKLKDLMIILLFKLYFTMKGIIILS